MIAQALNHPVTERREVSLAPSYLVGLALLLSASLMAQQADPDIDVKYSDLYRDIVFEEKKEWREAPERQDAWRAVPPETLDNRNRFKAGYDPNHEALQERQYFRQNENRNLYNDPRPNTVLRWDFD